MISECMGLAMSMSHFVNFILYLNKILARLFPEIEADWFEREREAFTQLFLLQ